MVPEQANSIEKLSPTIFSYCVKQQPTNERQYPFSRWPHKINLQKMKIHKICIKLETRVFLFKE